MDLLTKKFNKLLAANWLVVNTVCFIANNHSSPGYENVLCGNFLEIRIFVNYQAEKNS